MDLGAPELLIVLAVALLVLGPSQLPKVARSIGEAVREFRHAGHEPD
ncbi:MAG: twin-arginine translocase TatA/TatE family subunit [Acidimicrobiia bacterium]